jgi:hypothetical protein
MGRYSIDDEEKELKNGGTNNGSGTPPKSLPKQQKVNTPPSGDNEAKDDDSAESDTVLTVLRKIPKNKEPTCDTFMTFLDPDMLDTFLECAKTIKRDYGRPPSCLRVPVRQGQARILSPVIT